MAGHPASRGHISLPLSLPPEDVPCDFLGEKVGSFQKEFRETELESGMLWGGVALSEHRDDQTPRPSKDSLTRTS